MSEIVRMNLTGMAPETRALIKKRAAEVIRDFDGAPENVPEFGEARMLWDLIDEIEREWAAAEHDVTTVATGRHRLRSEVYPDGIGHGHE